MPRFEPVDAPQAAEVALEAGEAADVNLVDGDGLSVTMDDSTVAAIADTTFGGTRVIRVTGSTTFGRGMLYAMDGDNNVAAQIAVRVGPVHAVFRRGPHILVHDVSIVTLDRGASLAVRAADEGIVSVEEVVSAATAIHRRFRVTRVFQQPADTKLLGCSPAGDVFASVDVSTVDYVVGPTGITPDGQSSVAHPLGDVPDELLDAVDEGRLPCENRAASWADLQARFAFQYFLHAYHHTWKRSLDPRGALILLAQAGIETSYATTGPNASPNTPENNFLSFQPLDDNPGDPARVLREVYNIPVPYEPRSTNTGASPSPSPHFKDIDQSLEIQFVVAFELHVYTDMRDQLRASPPSPLAYAVKADAAQWGQKYTPDPSKPGSTNLPDEYDHCQHFVKRTLNNLPSGLTDEARSWALRLALQL